MRSLRLGLNLLLLLIGAKCTISIQYVPPDRKIIAIEDDRYVFGFGHDYQIAECTATSDTGISHSFHVWSKIKQSAPRQARSRITDRGIEGLCQIDVWYAEVDGPRKWNLEAIDLDKQVVANATFSVELFRDMPLLRYDIRVIEGAGFLNHMVVPNDIALASCYVLVNNTVRIELDLGKTKSNDLSPSDGMRSDDLTKKLSSLGHGYCGFKYVNTTMQVNDTRWSLGAVDTKGVSYMRSFTSWIEPSVPKNELYSKVKVSLGTDQEIYCGTEYSTCSIFNPEGKVVERKECLHHISFVTMKDIGLWKCLVLRGGSIESVEYQIDLVVKETSPQIIGWSNETDEYVNIGCRLSSNYSVSCKMVAPNEEIFNVNSGLATDRYLTLGTDLSYGTCSLMIKKPLKKFENGAWRCELQRSGIPYNASGTLLNVGETKPIERPKYSELTVKLYTRFVISCEASRPIDYCHIESPLGVKHPPDSPAELKLGRCFFVQRSAYTDHKGNWTCRIAQETGLPDLETVVNVFIRGSLTISSKAVPNGDSLILCNARDTPLDYCRFSSPNNVNYHVREDDANVHRISYFGKGIKWGDCGIKISNTQQTDFGNWTCTVRLSGDNEEVTKATLLLPWTF